MKAAKYLSAALFVSINSIDDLGNMLFRVGGLENSNALTVLGKRKKKKKGLSS